MNTDQSARQIRDGLLSSGPAVTPTLFALVGLPASGKSSWARQMQKAWPVIKTLSKDHLRLMLDNGQFSIENESFIRHMRLVTINMILNHGYSVIVDDTNLNPSSCGELSRLAEEFPVTYVEVSFTDIPVDECISRDAKRTGSAHVGETVIRRMHNMYLRPLEDINDSK